MTDGDNVFKINQDSVSLVENLKSNHEEADIRMTLHAKHASNSHDRILIASPDTDVFVLCVSLENYIDGRIYFLTGVKNSRRIIDIKAVGENFFTSINVCNAADELFLASIIGFHSFTRCGTVSTFSGRVEAKPLKLMIKGLRYIEAFSMFDKEITLPDAMVNTLEVFVCHIYGWKGNDVDNVRCRMYFKSGGKISCDALPPCNDALKLHSSRANYQTYIWRQSLVAQQKQLDRINHGWMHDDEEDCLTVEWMKCKPAPDGVRMLIPNF